MAKFWSIGNAVEKWLELKGFSPHQAAKYINEKLPDVKTSAAQITNMTLSDGFGVKHANMLARAFEDLSLEWLIAGKGNPEKSDIEQELDRLKKEKEILEESSKEYLQLEQENRMLKDKVLSVKEDLLDAKTHMIDLKEMYLNEKSRADVNQARQDEMKKQIFLYEKLIEDKESKIKSLTNN